MISKCLKCGIEKEMASSALCVDCTDKDTPIIKDLKFKSVQVCPRCGSYSYFKEWHKGPKDVLDLIHETIVKGLKINQLYELIDISIDSKFIEKESNSKKHFYNLILKLKLKQDYEFNYLKKLRFHVTDSLCIKCLKMNNNYFEGVFQIRGKDNEKYSEVEDFIVNLVKKRKDCAIHKIVSDKNGIDIYVTNKRALLDIGLKSHAQFGGWLDQNAQLFSWNKMTSKDVFRLNVLLRLPDFSKHDLVEINGNTIIVKKIRGKKVIGINVIDQKEHEFDFNNTSYEIVAKKSDCVMKTTISNIYPSIQIFNENYESVDVIDLTDKKDKLKQGHNVLVIFYQGKYYLIK